MSKRAGVGRSAHFISDAEGLNEAMREGTPVRSLCGKLWVPSRDPNKFPLCPTCTEAIRRGWAA